MKKCFNDRSWKDYTKWTETDEVITGKINSMIKSVEAEGGIPDGPEDVIYVQSIDEINQLAFRKKEDILEILSCRGQFHPEKEEQKKIVKK